MNKLTSPAGVTVGDTEDGAPVRPPFLLRRYLLFAVAVFALLLLINQAVQWLQPHTFNGTLLQAAAPLADFQLATTTGKPMRLSDFRGKYLLLYFGYTYCPDACPLTLANLADMMKRLGPAADQVQVILVSLDPERDTVEQLASYLPHFHPTFLGMTGAREEILKVATQFGIFYEKRGETAGYTIDHTSTVIVVDPEGRPQVIFPYGATGEQMADDLRYLLR
ncbi:MAG: SCO family protein [Caldilinea sp. CFX5]|nr:SCO family protein [Caldilinea sp. CFX5]